jgi:hypothetical protein
MTSKLQIEKLAARIELLAATVSPELHRPVEIWIVDEDRAWQPENPDHVISVAEMRAREVNADLVAMHIVYARNGRPVSKQTWLDTGGRHG